MVEVRNRPGVFWNNLEPSSGSGSTGLLQLDVRMNYRREEVWFSAEHVPLKSCSFISERLVHHINLLLPFTLKNRHQDGTEEQP